MSEKNEILENILKKIDEINKQREAFLVDLRLDFSPLLKPIFEKYPAVNIVTLPAYTDHWNDGEECTYDVRFYQMRVNDLDEWDIRDKPELTSAYQEFQYIFKLIDDDFYKDLFGDHIQIVCTKDGKVIAEKYEHD